MRVDTGLEEADIAARNVQYAGLDPALGAQVTDLDAMVVRAVAQWPDHPFLSQVVGLGVRGPVRQPALTDALGVLDRLGATAPMVSVVEGVSPDAVPAWLSALGFAPELELVRLVHRGSLLVTGGFRVEVVGPEAGEDVVTVCAGLASDRDAAWWRAGLGQPGWVQVLAYVGERPVGTGGLYVADGVGLLGSTTTLPEFRGRGVHAAMLATRLRLAADAGARRVGTLAEEFGPSYRNLLRAGFEPCHKLTQWRRAA